MITRKGHVKYVIDVCAELAKTQIKEYKGKAGDMKGKKQSTLQFLPLFQLCHGHVCHRAMMMAYEQLQFVRQIPGPLPMCTGTYHGFLGVPCRHIMQRVLFDNQPLDPAEFHAHWRYERGAGPLSPLDDRYFVRDPAVLRFTVR